MVAVPGPTRLFLLQESMAQPTPAPNRSEQDASQLCEATSPFGQFIVFMTTLLVPVAHSMQASGLRP
jgi:hypothetical protein